MNKFVLIACCLLTCNVLASELNTREVVVENRVAGARAVIYYNGLDPRAQFSRPVLSRAILSAGESKSITMADHNYCVGIAMNNSPTQWNEPAQMNRDVKKVFFLREGIFLEGKTVLDVIGL